jgi:hypothetical protein
MFAKECTHRLSPSSESSVRQSIPHPRRSPVIPEFLCAPPEFRSRIYFRLCTCQFASSIDYSRVRSLRADASEASFIWRAAVTT